MKKVLEIIGWAFGIVAYVCTLKQIENTPPQNVLNAPTNLFARTIPFKRTPPPDADTSNVYEYGKYLDRAASCADCHIQRAKGKPLPGLDFAGGSKFPFPNGAVARSANITPNERTGIGVRSESDFVSRFKF